MVFKLQAEDKKILRAVGAFASGRKIKLYLVGGFLRDAVLKRAKPNPDLDFSLKKGAINFGRALSKKIRCGFVVLEKKHGACRLVNKAGEKTYTLDFTDFRAPSIEKDLLLRDFTINTLAMDMDSGRLIDLYGAIRDIKSGQIKLAQKKAFDEDPLRILRAFSFSASLRFKITPSVLSLARRKAGKLFTVSGERIRDELFKILDTAEACEYFLMLDKYGVLKVIFPEIQAMRGLNQGPYHHLDVLKHSFQTLSNLSSIVAELSRDNEIRFYLEEILSSGRKRGSLLKLAAFLHDIGKPKARRKIGRKLIFHGHEMIGAGMVKTIAKRLKLSNDETDSLRRIAFCHLRPGYLSDVQPISRRAKFRYFRDTSSDAIGILLVSLADQRATRGRLTTTASRARHEKLVAGLIREYFRKQKEVTPAKLINGDDLIRKFKLQPSPLIGKLLREIEELQAIGRIRSKSEALASAARMLKKGA